MSRQSELDAAVAEFRGVHPEAKKCHEWGIDGWKVRVQDPPAGWKGTMPPTDLVFLPTEKKAGLTFHLWDPRNPELLAKNKEWLKEKGFKPMVGCLQWNRKTPVDVDALRRLFELTR